METFEAVVLGFAGAGILVAMAFKVMEELYGFDD